MNAGQEAPQVKKPTKKQQLLKVVFDTRLFDLLRPFSKNRLTVLNYHRINDPLSPGFSEFVPNVSATPQRFADHLDYMLAKGYDFISMGEFLAFLEGDQSLPAYAALVTFDDGYEDNYSIAYPILKERGIPATIFLATDYIDSDVPFYWDLVAYCFSKTPFTEKMLPGLGLRIWHDKVSRDAVADEWVRYLKLLPESEKAEMLAGLPTLLDVEVRGDDLAGKHMTWDQVRELSGNLITFGAHTKSHPILTRISLNDAVTEIVQSKEIIESEIGIPVETIAYPNGGDGDFNDEVIQAVDGAGYKAAFSLIGGVPKYIDLRRKRFAIDRIYLGMQDTVPRLAAKLNPLVQKIQG